MSSVPVGHLSIRKDGSFPIPEVKGAIPLKIAQYNKNYCWGTKPELLHVKFVFLLAVCGQHDSINQTFNKKRYCLDVGDECNHQMT